MIRVLCCALLASLSCSLSTLAADNTLTEQEKREGWILLFDGKSADQWLAAPTRGGVPLPAANIQDGSINPHKAGGYVIYTKNRYSNFVLSLDYKVSPKTNSGIYVRVGDPKNPTQTGSEIQIMDDHGKPPSKGGNAALYDVKAPSQNLSKPAGEWNHVEITADKNIIKVVLNGQQVIQEDLDQYTTPGKSIDGTKNKFKLALKDKPREGHIALQDHDKQDDHNVWYKNIKLTPLN